MSAKREYWFLILTLAGLSAFGPFVTDMYLPTLPQIPEIFSCSVVWAQMGLSASMLGLALGQLGIGPLSDRYGRRAPLLFSLLLFAASTLGCLFSSDIYTFTLMRFLQGLGGAGGIVISRSMSSDLYSGRDLLKFLGVIAAVHGVAPVAAPVAGGAFLLFTDWRGIFAALLVLGILLFACSLRLKETLPAARRRTGSPWAAFGLFKNVFGNRACALYIFQQACVSGMLFSYIAASPFIFQVHFGLSAQAFSLCFAFNAIGIAIGAYLARYAKSPPAAVIAGCCGALCAAAALWPLLACGAPVGVFECALFLMLASCGLTFPSAATVVLDLGRANAGTAAALLGAFPFFVGGALAPVVGMGDVPLTASGIIFAAAASALVLAVVARRAVGRAYANF